MTRYRTYDDWKLASPDDEADAQSDQPVADCDCCGKRRPVFRTWYARMETWACEECTDGSVASDVNEEDTQ